MDMGQECQHAFEALEKGIIEALVLAFPNLNKLFELYTVASNFTIGGVLMQESHLIFF